MLSRTYFTYIYIKSAVEGNMIHKRPAGGIEPLRLSSATGLKPALQTTEAQQGN